VRRSAFSIASKSSPNRIHSHRPNHTKNGTLTSAASPSSSRNLKNETFSEPALKNIGARRPGKNRPMKSPAVPCFANSSSTRVCFAGGKIRRNQAVPSSRVPKRRPAKKIMLSPHRTPAYMNALTRTHDRPSLCPSMPAVISTTSSGNGRPSPQRSSRKKGPQSERGVP